MTRFLLDTNHLSAYLAGHPSLGPRIDSRLRAGDRFGIVLAVLCEYRAGIQIGTKFQKNLARLQAALGIFRIWPSDEQTSIEFAKLFHELRQQGRMLSQFDLLIAAAARQYGLTLLTADQDFAVVPSLARENWL